MVENRRVGIKSREVYECPGALALLMAHADLEDLTLERDLAHEKARLEPRYAELVYDGLWFSPLKAALDAFVDESQRFVTGDVRLRCELPGRCIVAGRRSDVGLYDYSLATYEAADRFRHQDAEGFVRLWGLGVATWAARQVNRSRSGPAGVRRSMTLWQGRFGEEGPAEELLAYTVEPALRPAPGRRRHGRVARPRAGAGRRGDLSDGRGQDPAGGPRPGRRRAGGRRPGLSSPATRTCTPPSNGGSRRSPARSAPGCIPGRSRNDQIATDLRLFAKRELLAVAHRIQDLQAVLLERARAAEDAYLPGYTHLQRAQPVLLAHHLLAHGWALARDVDRLIDTRRRLDVSPLGAGRPGRLVAPARSRPGGRRTRLRRPASRTPSTPSPTGTS